MDLTHNSNGAQNYEQRVAMRMEEIATYEDRIPSYADTFQRMRDFHSDDPTLLFTVFSWRHHFTQLNYQNIKLIMMQLYKLPYDYYEEEYDVDSDSKRLIKAIGYNIANQGGLEAMQSCFYIMINFMDIHNDKRLKGLQLCWDGVAQWSS